MVPAPFSFTFHPICLRHHPRGCLFLYSVFFVLLCSALTDWATWSGSSRHLGTVSKTRYGTVYCWSSFLWNVATSILPFFILSGAPTAHDVSNSVKEGHRPSVGKLCNTSYSVLHRTRNTGVRVK